MLSETKRTRKAPGDRGFLLGSMCNRLLGLLSGGTSLDILCRMMEGRLALITEVVLTGRRCGIALVGFLIAQQIADILEDVFHGIAPLLLVNGELKM